MEVKSFFHRACAEKLDEKVVTT